MSKFKSIFKILKLGFYSEGNYELQKTERRKGITLQKKKNYTITTWNIGYCNLGQESSWIFNGGKRFITASKDEVSKNVSGILKSLKKIGADFFLIQEMPKRSVFTYYTNPYSKFVSALKKYSAFFGPKISIKSVLVPGTVGSSTFSKAIVSQVELPMLPNEKDFFLGKQLQHHMLITKHPIKRSMKYFYTINIHFPAYDKNGDSRKEHLDLVLKTAQDLYKKGHYVICGGDWNLLFSPKSSFAYETNELRIRHVLPLPKKFLPKGWQQIFDPVTPSLRELDGPYIPGKNFVGVVDGFFVSPNIKVHKTVTHDHQFEYSDHNPASLDFSLQ